MAELLTIIAGLLGVGLFLFAVLLLAFWPAIKADRQRR